MDDLLKQKLDALIMILEATERLKLTGEGDDDKILQEAELFSSLYEQRAEVITKIQKLDEELSRHEEVKADKKLLTKIKNTAEKIAELDKKNLEVSEKFKVFLQGNLKKIRDGRDVSNAYVDENLSTSGYYFDRTN